MEIKITKEEIKEVNLERIKSRLVELQNIEKCIQEGIRANKYTFCGGMFFNCEEYYFNSKGQWKFIGWTHLGSLNPDNIKEIKLIKDDVYIYFEMVNYKGEIEKQRIRLCDQVKVYLFEKIKITPGRIPEKMRG